MKIKEAIKEYLVEIEIRGYSKKTLRTYGTKLNIFCRWCEEVEEIDDVEDIRLSTIKKYTQAMQRAGKAGSYINGTGKTLKSFITYIYDEGYGGFNTKGKWTWVKEKKPHIVAFTPKQARQLLAGCHGNTFADIRDMCIITMFLETGIRCQELYSIKNTDIHDDYFIVHGKGNKDRSIAITPYLKKAMMKYERVKENYFALRHSESYYFLSYTGKQLTNSAIEHMMKKRGKLIEGDVRCSPHTCRHFWAQQQLKMGNMDIYSISRALGHENLHTTEIYLRSLSEKDVIRAAKSSSVLMNM